MMNVKRASMNKSNAATVVRAIMNSHGKTRVYNNLYDTGTRTVKCYGRPDTSSKMVFDITRALTGLGVAHKIKFTDPAAKHFYAGGPGIIVKLV
jgi:hypothetical protein